MLFATATWMMAGTANAQSPVLKVSVPFNFTVNSTFLPAGNYEVGFDSMHPNVLVIQDRAKNVRATAYVQRGSIDSGKEHTLIFHRYGDQYFLNEAGFDSASDGVSLPVTKLEKRASMNRHEELASIAGR
jgi:hypothetical protein